MDDASADASVDASVRPLTIVVIVLLVLLTVVLSVLVILHFVRKRQRAAQGEYQQPGPFISQPSFKTKSRKMSASDRVVAEEMERAIMIRKSLASRASSGSSTVSRTSRTSVYRLEELDRQEREGLAAKRESWKEEEAGILPMRPTPGIHDTQLGVHPALLPQPQLAFPPPSRSPSPLRGIKPPQLYIPSR